MDQRLAVEAHLHALAALGLEAVGVLHIVVHAVEDHLARFTGSEQCSGEVRHQRVTVRHQRRPQFFRKIVGAHHEHSDPRVCRDGAYVEHRRRCLDHRPDHHLEGTCCVEQCGHPVDVVDRVDLGDHDRRRARRSGGRDVIAAPLGAESVAADRQLAVAVEPRLHRCDRLAACIGLGVGGDGIFEIEDDRIGRDGLCLLECTVVCRRHVQHGTAGAQIVGHRAHRGHRGHLSGSDESSRGRVTRKLIARLVVGHAMSLRADGSHGDSSLRICGASEAVPGGEFGVAFGQGVGEFDDDTALLD